MQDQAQTFFDKAISLGYKHIGDPIFHVDGDTALCFENPQGSTIEVSIDDTGYVYELAGTSVDSGEPWDILEEEYEGEFKIEDEKELTDFLESKLDW